MFRIMVILATIVIVFGSVVVSQQRQTASPAFDEASLKAHVKFLSDDKLEGRGTGAPGGQMAAKYIAEQLKAIGAKGAAADGSFFQPVSLVGVKADPNTTLTISGPNGSETLKFADDFVAFTGAQARIVELPGSELVFVGYGINAPEQRWNDYEGPDANYFGKILVMLVNDPLATTAEPNLFGGRAPAEEQGLLGAEWYVKHPVVPIDKTAANVNLDSMNILNPTHDFIPLGAERSTLKGVVEAVAKNMGLRVSPDARPEQGSFYRSDHFPFAKAGVPSISLKEGNDYVGRSKEWAEEQFRAYNSAHYHQPSDEMRDTWDFRALIQSAEIALAIGRMISDSPEKPRFNPDDEFAKKPATR